MKHRLSLLPVSILALTVPAFAGETAAEAPAPATHGPDAYSWLQPTIDIRARHEFREEDLLDPSHALTARARVGLLAGAWHGFSAMGELEATGALVDDYNAGGGAEPVVPGNTDIQDPENFELNRAWVQYAGHGFTAKVGRQRIIRNNAAFVGNVAWRQNEQTFDAASLAYAGDGFDLFYAYANRVRRIFGYSAAPFSEEMDGDFHFLDGSVKLDAGTLGGYIYLVDADNVTGVAASTNVGESNTFGAYYKIGDLHLEAAWQDGESTLVAGSDYDAFYGHLIYTKKLGDGTLVAGLEYLEENFKTPLATVHPFDGFADAFVGQRIGLNNKGGMYKGLSDLYVSYGRPVPWGCNLTGFAHYFLDDGFNDPYGWELDAVLSKKFNEHLSGLIKAAFFFEDDGPRGYQDISQVSVQVDFTF
jgi:hypothetical protein